MKKKEDLRMKKQSEKDSPVSEASASSMGVDRSWVGTVRAAAKLRWC